MDGKIESTTPRSFAPSGAETSTLTVRWKRVGWSPSHRTLRPHCAEEIKELIRYRAQ
jgi:hypothetical protein